MRVAWFVSSLACGCALAALACAGTQRRLSRAPHGRTNFRGRTVAGTLGMVLALPLVVGAAMSLAAGADVRIAWVIAGTGIVFGALGLIDDLYGDRSAGGLLGHARELLRAHVTTGAIKALGGGLAGLAAAFLLGRRGVWILIGGVVVALAANLTNLLDLRPGRALKAWMVAWAALLAAVGVAADAAPASAGLAGGVTGFLPFDLRERGMLGDVGAGIAGAVLGTAAVASLSGRVLVVVAVGLAVVTLLSERFSFTRAIEGFPPLRWLDGLGRARE